MHGDALKTTAYHAVLPSTHRTAVKLLDVLGLRGTLCHFMVRKGTIRDREVGGSNPLAPNNYLSDTFSP